VRHMREASLPEPTWSVCAGAYAFGTLGRNECPANYPRVQAEVACRVAAAAAGQAYKGSETDPGYPPGCYSTTLMGGVLGVYFNMATTGAGQLQSKLLCSGARFLARPSWVPFVYRPGYLLNLSLGTSRLLHVQSTRYGVAEYPIWTRAESTIEYGTLLWTRPYKPLAVPTVPTGPLSTVTPLGGAVWSFGMANARHL
jgi:hypothetical protein